MQQSISAVNLRRTLTSWVFCKVISRNILQCSIVHKIQKQTSSLDSQKNMKAKICPTWKQSQMYGPAIALMDHRSESTISTVKPRVVYTIFFSRWGRKRKCMPFFCFGLFACLFVFMGVGVKSFWAFRGGCPYFFLGGSNPYPPPP